MSAVSHLRYQNIDPVVADGCTRDIVLEKRRQERNEKIGGLQLGGEAGKYAKALENVAVLDA